jgi:type III secretory pathway lipoprotein EscJ
MRSCVLVLLALSLHCDATACEADVVASVHGYSGKEMAIMLHRNSVEPAR